MLGRKRFENVNRYRTSCCHQGMPIDNVCEFKQHCITSSWIAFASHDVPHMQMLHAMFSEQACPFMAELLPVQGAGYVPAENYVLRIRQFPTFIEACV